LRVYPFPLLPFNVYNRISLGVSCPSEEQMKEQQEWEEEALILVTEVIYIIVDGHHRIRALIKLEGNALFEMPELVRCLKYMTQTYVCI
jgi:BarA-like signal transduction histidine kinase